jgi:hypothetical protein
VAEELGIAVLQLTTDQAPLNRGLASAEARTKTSVAAMQKTVDQVTAAWVREAAAAKLAGDETVIAADKATAALLREAAAAKLAGDAQVQAATRADAAGAGRGATGVGSLNVPDRSESRSHLSESGLYGVRGAHAPGSLQNPLVVVLEAGKYAPMGSFAAAIGDAGMADQSGGTSPVASALDLQALSDQVGELARNMSPAARLASEGGRGLTTPTVSTPGARTQVQDPEGTLLLAQAVETLRKLEQGITEHPLIPTPGKTSYTSTRSMLVPASTGGQSSAYQTALANQAAADAAERQASSAYSRTISARSPASAEEQQAALAQRNAAIAEATAAAAQTKAAQASIASSATPGGGGGAHGGLGDFIASLPGGGHGGGGHGALMNLLKGEGGEGGHFGLPTFGSIGSLGGLGLEHWLLSGLGVGATAVGALGGASLLGASSLTQGLVGGGADALVSKDTLDQAKAMNTNVQALNKAVAVYGANSKQAAAAQYDLNQQWAELGGGAGKQAIETLDANADAVKKLFDTESAGAREQAAGVMDQVVQLGSVYTPLIVSAAQRNLTIVNSGLQPLFAWLEGPQGIQIFTTLEDAFSKDLPVAINAFDQGLEAFLKLMGVASGSTGGLAQHLDNLFTKKNAEPLSDYDAEVQKLLGDLHEWDTLLKLLGEDLEGVFKADAGTGNSIVAALTGMLEKLHEWEDETTSQDSLRNIFAVHRTEILAILKLLPDLVTGFGSFYLEVAPPLVTAFTDIAKAIGFVLGGLEKLSPATADLVGLMIVMAKLGVLVPVIKAVGSAIGLELGQSAETTAQTAALSLNTAALRANAIAGTAAAGASGELTLAEKANTPVAVADAAATGELAISEDAVGTSALARLAPGAMLGGLGETAAAGASGLGLGTLAAGGVGVAAMGAAAGGAGILGGAVAQHAVGLRGGTAGTIAGGVAGAGAAAAIGAALGVEGGPLGILLGAGIGATLGPTVEHLFSGLFGHGEDYGKEFAQSFAAPFAQYIKPAIEETLASSTASALDSARKAAAAAKAGPPRAPTDEGRGGVLGAGAGPRGPDQAQLDAQAAAKDKAAGVAAATLFDTGYASVAHPGEYSFATDAIAELQKLEPQYRDAAAAQMLTYAQTLVAKGQLPKNAIEQLVFSLESQFPALSAYLKANAEQTGSELADAYKFTQAQSQLKTTLGQFREQFGIYSADKDVTGANLVATTGVEMANLTIQWKQGVAGAGQALTQLKAQTAATFDAMLAKVTSSAQAQTAAIAGGSQQSAVAVAQNFSNLQSTVEQAMNNGVLSVSTGTNEIAAALNATLKAFGTKTIPWAAIQAIAPNPAGLAALGAGAGHTGAAGGGLIQIGSPGQAGMDTVPLNVGGMPIMVGPGEQVAVFNRHQIPIVNAALGGMGGLSGLFGQVTTPNYMAGGGLVGASSITAPGVTGTGAIPDIVRAAVRLMTADANSYIGAHGPPSSGGGSGGGNIGSASGLSGSLIAMVHQLAKQFGWSSPGLIQDWLNVINAESGGSMTAQNPTSPAYGIAQFISGPGEYAQYGGNVNTQAGQLLAMANYIRQRYGSPAAAWAHELSDHNYSAGGMIGDPWGPFQGPVTDAKTGRKIPQSFLTDSRWDPTAPRQPKAKAPAKAKPLSGVTLMQTLGQGADMTAIDGALKVALGLDGLTGGGSGTAGASDVSDVQERISYYEGLWGLDALNYSSDPSDFVVTTDPATGLAVAPYIDEGALSEATKQLQEILAWDGQIIADLQRALSLSKALVPAIKAAIAKRQAEIAAIKRKIAENLAAITVLRKQRAKKGVSKAAKKTLEKQINALYDQNQALGGDRTAVGTGGQIGPLETQVASLQANLGPVETWPFLIEGGTGLGGTMQGFTLDRASQLARLQALSPGAATTLTIDAASVAASSSPDSALLGLVEQQLQVSGEQLAVDQLQYGVLANLPPFGGSFAAGGVVPGPVGAARTIIAHGGEPILPVGSDWSGGETHVHIDKRSDLAQLIDVRITKAGRTTARHAGRGLPGRGGGIRR